MKWFSGLTMAVVLAMATAAVAQEKPAAEPVRLELAKQLVAASGGPEAARKMLDSMYASMDQTFAKVIPADKMPLFRAMQQDIKAETLKMIPDLMDQSVDIYARVMTEQELRDMLAFYQSESGRSILRKTPIVMDEVMRAQVPYMQKMMPRLMRKAMDNACKEAKCTAAEQREFAKVMARAMGEDPS